MTSVIMDENDLDVDICFDEWVLAYWGLLERNHMMPFHEKHPKIAVGALNHGLRPASLRRWIQNHLKLDHKPPKFGTTNLRLRQIEIRSSPRARSSG